MWLIVMNFHSAKTLNILFYFILFIDHAAISQQISWFSHQQFFAAEFCQFVKPTNNLLQTKPSVSALLVHQRSSLQTECIYVILLLKLWVFQGLLDEKTCVSASYLWSN